MLSPGQYKTLIGWLFIIVGWLISSALAFHYGMRKSWHDKALAVFEEVSVFIEKAGRLDVRICKSFRHNELSNKRIDLWRQYEALQADFADNTPRLQYLMQAYYGTEMRETFDWVWDQLVDTGADVVARCEAEKTEQVPESHRSLKDGAGSRLRQ